jgi:hypothetical protein
VEVAVRPLTNLDLVNGWNAIPIRKRIAILTLSIVQTEPRATDAVRNLLASACTMAEMLDEEERGIVAAIMRSEADLLDAKRWN